MIVPRVRYYEVFIDDDPAVIVEASCGHDMTFLRRHIKNSKVVGRPQCGTCRKVWDEFVLEGYE